MFVACAAMVKAMVYVCRLDVWLITKKKLKSIINTLDFRFIGFLGKILKFR